jgi:hypothetical protein
VGQHVLVSRRGKENPETCQRRGIESPDTCQIVGLQSAQRGVVGDGRPHHRPGDGAVVQAQQVAELVQGDGLDVESTCDRSVDPRLAVVEVQRLRVKRRPAGTGTTRPDADAA